MGGRHGYLVTPTTPCPCIPWHYNIQPSPHPTSHIITLVLTSPAHFEGDIICGRSLDIGLCPRCCPLQSHFEHMICLGTLWKQVIIHKTGIIHDISIYPLYPTSTENFMPFLRYASKQTDTQSYIKADSRTYCNISWVAISFLWRNHCLTQINIEIGSLKRHSRNTVWNCRMYSQKPTDSQFNPLHGTTTKN